MAHTYALFGLDAPNTQVATEAMMDAVGVPVKRRCRTVSG